MVPRETFLQWATDEKAYLQTFLNRNNLSISDSAIELLIDYSAILREINQVHNLISRKDEENIIRKHICHCLALAMYYPIESSIHYVADWGSGGGLPGIPLAILYPDTHFTLIESIQKKAESQTEIIRYLKLENVKSLRSRIEENTPAYPETLVVARALSDISNLIDWGKGWIQNGTKEMRLLKGGDIVGEIEGLPPRLRSKIKHYENRPIDCFGHEYIGQNKWVIRIHFQ